MKHKLLKQAVLAVIVICILPLPFFALGASDDFEAPVIEESNTPWKSIGIAGVALMGVVAAALMNSRRTQEKTFGA